MATAITGSNRCKESSQFLGELSQFCSLIAKIEQVGIKKEKLFHMSPSNLQEKEVLVAFPKGRVCVNRWEVLKGRYKYIQNMNSVLGVHGRTGRTPCDYQCRWIRYFPIICAQCS